MKTIAIINRRGGVGKTITALNIGAGLAHKKKKVLFIDLDSQENLSYDLGADKLIYTTSDMLLKNVPVNKIIQHKEKWDIIPAGSFLSTADTTLKGNGKEYKLIDALTPIKDQYDYCVIDTPPALNILTVNALTAANGVIIPAQAEIHSIQGIGLLYESIEHIKRYCNKDLQIYGILLTRYNGRAILSQDMKTNLEDMAGMMGTKLFKTPIRECIALKEAQATQQDIFTYSRNSNAAKDYTAVLKELLKDLERR